MTPFGQYGGNTLFQRYNAVLMITSGDQFSKKPLRIPDTFQPLRSGIPGAHDGSRFRMMRRYHISVGVFCQGGAFGK